MSYVVGIDVSDWQGDINWDLAKTKIQFAMLRASHGKNMDTHFERNATECDRLCIPWGCYHYANPGGGLTWQVQADFFLSLIPTTPKLGIWLDAEDSGGLDKVALESWYAKFLKRVEGNVPNTGIYTSPGYWNAKMPLTSWAKTKALWVAHWTTLANPQLPLDWKPKANPEGYPFTFWQWSADHNGKGPEYGAQSSDLDLDRFNGDEVTFNMLFGTHIVPLPEPPPPPSSVGELRVVAAGWANLRSTPTVAVGNDIGNLLKGCTFKPVGYKDGWYEIHGYVAESTVRKA